MPTPVYLITGFLGSGKTTLLNRLLNELPEKRKIAVIVNEFGSISIDGKLIRRGDYEVRELTSGCICCTLRVDIIKMLLSLIEDYSPQAIVIEATGLAIPRDLADNINYELYASKMYCAGIIGLINCAKYLIMAKHIMIINAQLKDFTTVVLNKTDLANKEKVSEIRNAIKTIIRPDAEIIESAFGEVPFKQLFPALFQEKIEIHKIERNLIEEVTSHSTNGIASKAFTTKAILSHDKLTDFFNRNKERLLRAKGIVCTDRGLKVFQFSPDGLSIEAYKETIEKSEMVIIASENDILSLSLEFNSIFN